MAKIDKEDGGIDIDTSKLDNESFEWTDEKSEHAKDYVKGTLQETLLSQYAPFDRTTHDLQLKIQPMSYELEHAFVIPVITREAIAKDSTLLDLYHDLDQSIIANSSSYDDVKEQVEDLIQKSGGSRTTFTLVVDLSVECREQFCVTEKESGKVVQGSKDGENVVLHLVRFEMVLTKLQTFGSWIISDWDDMLDGNVWHLRKDDKEESSDTSTKDEAETESSSEKEEKKVEGKDNDNDDDNAPKEKPSS